ncbi:MAG: carnitine dehydratase [Deltaproteobacteria bacterium]|nr:carnitine dehydratase [Deltaproteobacteria bacterium]
MSALQGTRVVELANESIGWAGKLMGDMGADVILVEAPGGEPSRGYAPFAGDEEGGESLYFWHYNTSKRSVVLDLDKPAGKEAFLALIASADVLIESEAPGRLSALGLDYDDLVKAKPDLIHVSVTPFGRETSRKDEPATDLTILAGGGPAWSCGYDDHSIAPIRGGGNQGYQTASHYAVMSALTAIFHHGVTGEGQFIDVSMHAAANVTTEMASYFYLIEQQTVIRQTGRHAMPMMTMPVQVQCKDGRYATTGMPPRSPAGFGALYDWLVESGLEDQLPEAIFLEMARHRESIGFADIGVDDEVTAAFSAARDALQLLAENSTAEGFFEGAQKINITVGAILSPEEAYENVHFKARGYQVEVDHPERDAPVRYPGAPYKLPASPWRISRRAPALGEHDDEVFGPLGVDAAKLAEAR